MLRVRFGVETAKHLAELIERKIRGPAHGNDTLFLLLNIPSDSGDFRRWFEWNLENSVPVSVEEVSWLDFQAPDLHRRSKLKNMSVGVGDRHVSSKKLETSAPHLRQIADGTIRNNREAPQGTQNVCVHFTDERAQSGAFFYIFHDHNARRRDLQNGLPPIRPIVVIVAVHGRDGCAHSRGGGVADGRREILENAPYAGVGESGIPQADVERFNRVRHGAGAQTAKRLQLLWSEDIIQCVAPLLRIIRRINLTA
jgi:hypothetical protein